LTLLLSGVFQSTQNMIFSATYCLELHVPIFFTINVFFLPSKGVNVL
jgi:hypothetical protein